jgi:hypothetical protein
MKKQTVLKERFRTGAVNIPERKNTLTGEVEQLDRPS